MVQLKLVSNHQTTTEDSLSLAWSRAVLQWQIVFFYGIAAGAQMLAVSIEHQCDRLR
jgi:hypothetical protein